MDEYAREWKQHLIQEREKVDEDGFKQTYIPKDLLKGVENGKKKDKEKFQVS